MTPESRGNSEEVTCKNSKAYNSRAYNNSKACNYIGTYNSSTQGSHKAWALGKKIKPGLPRVGFWFSVLVLGLSVAVLTPSLQYCVT